MDYLSRGIEQADDAAMLAIELFCDEYLGRPGAPVPFGGRGDALDALDAFLAHPTQVALLLSAPAGMGKSALLARWAAGLLARGVAVAFVPVSLRFDTGLARTVLRALAARLSHLHGAPLDLSREQPTAWWRAQVERLVATALPDGRTAVVIVDGVDETGEALLTETLFAPGLFARCKVVVSVRERAGDEAGESTLRALGWHRADGVSRMRLGALTAEGLVDVLAGLGLGGDALDEELSRALLRLTNGDPFLVKLYAHDLWRREGDAGRLRVADLRSLRQGLAGYFEGWWQDHEALRAQRDEAPSPWVNALLDVFAVARGPLLEEDLAQLVGPDLPRDSDEPARSLARLARFIVGDARRGGLALAHPRLNAYFAEERMTDAARAAVQARFLEWGARVSHGLSEGGAPDAVPLYLLRWYTAHMRSAQVEPARFVSLLRAPWRAAGLARTGDLDGFLTDIERAWEGARALGPSGYGVQWRWVLMLSSARSMESKVPPGLVARMLETGFWTDAQALSLVRRSGGEQRRGALIHAIASRVSVPSREVLARYARAMTQRARVSAEIALADALPEGDRSARYVEILRATEGLEDAQKGLILPGLLARLPEPERTEVASTLVDLYLQRHAPHAVFSALPPALWARVEQAMRALPIEARANLMPNLLGFMPEAMAVSLLREALAAIDALSPMWTQRFLHSVALQSPVALIEEIRATARRVMPAALLVALEVTLNARADTLSDVLAAFERTGRLPLGHPRCVELLATAPIDALVAAWRRRGRGEDRPFTVLELLPRLSERERALVCEELLDDQARLPSRAVRAPLPCEVFLGLPDSALARALRLTSRIHDLRPQQNALCALAAQLPPATQDAAWTHLLRAIETPVTDAGWLADLVAALPAARLPEALTRLRSASPSDLAALGAAVAIVTRIDARLKPEAQAVALALAEAREPSDLLQRLPLLAARLPAESVAPLRARVVAALDAKHPGLRPLDAWIRLAQCAPEAEREALWKKVDEVLDASRGSDARVVSYGLEGALPAEPLGVVLKLIARIEEPDERVRVLAALLRRVREPARSDVATKLVDEVEARPSGEHRLRALSLAICSFEAHERTDLHARFLDELARCPEHYRFAWISNRVRRLPAPLIEKVLPIAAQMGDFEERAATLCHLLALAPEPQRVAWMPRVLEALALVEDWPSELDVELIPTLNESCVRSLVAVATQDPARAPHTEILIACIARLDALSRPFDDITVALLQGLAACERADVLRALDRTADALRRSAGPLAVQDTFESVVEIGALWP